MSFRIYRKDNAIVLIDTDSWDVQKFPIGEIWYDYVATDSPVIYSFYYRNAERILVLREPYTSFQDGKGNGFADDSEFRDYIDPLLSNGVGNSLDGSGQIDAGGRIRVSQLTTQIDVKQINDNAPLFFDRENVSGATQVYAKNDGGTTMSVSSNGDAAICQSKMFANYFSGKSQFGEITFSGGQNQDNVTKRIGYFSSNTVSPYDSDKDGLWFEADGTDYRFRIQKNGTDIVNVAQSDWNINTLPNSDFSKFNVFVFQFLYLGGTEIRFGFVQNGAITWCHGYKHAGIIANTFVESPNQPIRYEVRSTGGSGSMIQVCAQVASEGSIDEVGVHRAFDVENVALNPAGGNIYAVIGARLKSAYRNITVKKQDLSVLATTNDNFIWRVSINPTVGGTFTYNDQTNSSLQVATGATTNTVSSLGTVIASGHGTGNSQISSFIRSSLRLGTQIDGTQDELVLSLEPITNNFTAYATIGFQEFI